MHKLTKISARIFRRAATYAHIPNVDASTKAFERHLDAMLSSSLFCEHDIHSTIDVKHVYVVIAMCLELRSHGLSDDVIREAVCAGFAARRRFFDVLVAVVDHLPFAWALVRRWNVNDHKRRTADGSIDFVRFEVSEHAIEYHISGCRYVDMFEAWGIRPLCKIFCETDTRSYAGLKRHVVFVRHSDLSDGSSCHDEIFGVSRGRRFVHDA